jgi:transposase
MRGRGFEPQNVRAKKGYKVAIVALARKLLCIIHHHLVNQELYEEEGIRKHIKMDKFEPSKTARMDLDETISFLVRAGYHVQKREAG